MMKIAQTAISGLKTAVKYGAFVMALIKVIEFAVETFESINTEKPTKDEK